MHAKNLCLHSYAEGLKPCRLKIRSKILLPQPENILLFVSDAEKYLNQLYLEQFLFLKTALYKVVHNVTNSQKGNFFNTDICNKIIF